jgi:hypothetical protein
MSGGVSVSTTVGNVGGFAITLALVGALISGAQGAVTPNADGIVPLTGQASTTSAGVAAPDYSRAPTGSESTSASGTLTIGLRPTDPVGQAITSAAGFTSASSSNVTANITGQEAAFSPGTVIQGAGTAGSASTTAAGTAAPTVTIPISGLAAAFAAGTLAPDQSAGIDTAIFSGIGSVASLTSTVALAGIASTSGQGTVVTSGDEFIAVSGQATTSAAGTLFCDKQFPISGVQSTSAVGTLGAPGQAALTGVQASVTAGQLFTTGDRSFALSGQSITTAHGITFASSLAFVFGQQLAGGTGIIGDQIKSLSGLAASVGQGSFGFIVEDLALDGWVGPQKLANKKKKIQKDPADVEAENAAQARVRLRDQIAGGMAKPQADIPKPGIKPSENPPADTAKDTSDDEIVKAYLEFAEQESDNVLKAVSQLIEVLNASPLDSEKR